MTRRSHRFGKEVFVIAEIGGNHDGDLEAARRLVQAAARAGADAVKFQTYRAEDLVHPRWGPMPNVKHGYSSQFDRFKSLEFSISEWNELAHMAKEIGIEFMTTPFSEDALDALENQMSTIKIASGDLTYHSLLKKANDTGKPVILSTGMAALEEIDDALQILTDVEVVLMHCVSLYPTPPQHGNLRRITALKNRWPNLVVGYSDHTIGTLACLGAVALGARVIEKHFTLSKQNAIGDHQLSADAEDMRKLVERIREMETLLCQESDLAADAHMKKHLRRGVYAKHRLGIGTRISVSDLIFIRPEMSLRASDVDQIINKMVRSEIAAMEPIDPDSLS